MDKEVGVLVGMARWLSAVTNRLLGSVGLVADWAYQWPVVSASVRFSTGLLLSSFTVAGGGGAITKTSCCATGALAPALREYVLRSAMIGVGRTTVDNLPEMVITVVRKSSPLGPSMRMKLVLKGLPVKASARFGSPMN
ncbi:hypothetical protein D3C85_1416830 [compost metagenome]